MAQQQNGSIEAQIALKDNVIKVHTDVINSGVFEGKKLTAKAIEARQKALALAVKQREDLVGIAAAQKAKQAAKQPVSAAKVEGVAAAVAPKAAAPVVPAPVQIKFADLKVGGTYLSVYEKSPGLQKGRFPFDVVLINDKVDPPTANVMFIYPVRTVAGRETLRADEPAQFFQSKEGQWYHNGFSAMHAPIQVFNLEGEEKRIYDEAMVVRKAWIAKRDEAVAAQKAADAARAAKAQEELNAKAAQVAAAPQQVVAAKPEPAPVATSAPKATKAAKKAVKKSA